MKNLIWTIVDDGKALILGTPLLPLQGEVFWRKDDFLFPTGYELELSALFDTLNTLVNAKSQYCIVWDKESNYWKVHKDSLKPLSISSFHLSLKG